MLPGPAERQPVKMEILVKEGPLCVGGVWDWEAKRRVQGLFFIYLIRAHMGIHFGPYYASLSLAERDMKKALKEYPPGFWEQPLEWYGRQEGFMSWVNKNMGRPDYLIGGVWAKD